MANRKGFGSPHDPKAVDDGGNLTVAYSQWVSQVTRFVQAGMMSGTTADRPADNLWIGRFYYDETLGKPVWVHAVSPVVWHDAAGAAV